MHWVFLAPYLACLPIFMRTSQQHSSPTLSGSTELRRQLTAQRKHVLCHWLRSCGFFFVSLSWCHSRSLSLFHSFLVHPLIGFLVAAGQTGLFSLLYCSGRQAEREREREWKRERERERERGGEVWTKNQTFTKNESRTRLESFLVSTQVDFSQTGSVFNSGVKAQRLHKLLHKGYKKKSSSTDCEHRAMFIKRDLVSISFPGWSLMTVPPLPTFSCSATMSRNVWFWWKHIMKLDTHNCVPFKMTFVLTLMTPKLFLFGDHHLVRIRSTWYFAL